MTDARIGDELKQERLRQGLTLDDIIRRTRISPRSIDAIEADDFDRLPGIVFARSFVRLYANELRMDADSLVSRLPNPNIEAMPLPMAPRTSRAKWDPRLIAALASVFWLVTASAAGTGAWYYFNHHVNRSGAEHPSPVPAGIPMSAPAAPARLSGALSGELTGELTESNVETASLTEGSQADSSDPTRPVQVILTAREAAWVQISADGRAGFVGLLHPHDTRAVAADDQVRIMTRNAGGIDISLNGKTLDPIGPSGQVRTVRLTVDGPQFAPQNPPASSPL